MDLVLLLNFSQHRQKCAVILDFLNTSEEFPAASYVVLMGAEFTFIGLLFSVKREIMTSP
jgi:hypothetical protein